MHIFIKRERTMALTAALSTLELTALGADIRLDVALGASRNAKVLNSLAGVLLSAEEEAVGAGGAALGQLVKSQALTASLDNASTGSLGEAKGSDLHLGGLDKALVISDGADNDGDALLLGGHSQVLAQGAQGHGGTVDLAHTQALQDNLVEAGSGTAGQEAVELDQEVQVDVVALGRGTLQSLDVVILDINTLRTEIY